MKKIVIPLVAVLAFLAAMWGFPALAADYEQLVVEKLYTHQIVGYDGTNPPITAGESTFSGQVTFNDGALFNDEVALESYSYASTTGTTLTWAFNYGNVLFLSGTTPTLIQLPTITSAMDGYILYVKNTSGATTRTITPTAGVDAIEAGKGTMTSTTDATIDAVGEWRAYVADYTSAASGVWKLIGDGTNNIDGVVIGGTTPAAGTFTTLTGTAGNLTGMTAISGAIVTATTGASVYNLTSSSGITTTTLTGTIITATTGTTTTNLTASSGVTTTTLDASGTIYQKVVTPTFATGVGYSITGTEGNIFLINSTLVVADQCSTTGPSDQAGVTVILPAPTAALDGAEFTIIKSDTGASDVFLYSAGLPIDQASKTTDALTIAAQGDAVTVVANYNSAVSYWVKASRIH